MRRLSLRGFPKDHAASDDCSGSMGVGQRTEAAHFAAAEEIALNGKFLELRQGEIVGMAEGRGENAAALVRPRPGDRLDAPADAAGHDDLRVGGQRRRDHESDPRYPGGRTPASSGSPAASGELATSLPRSLDK